jgi:type II secretory pathway component PulF
MPLFVCTVSDRDGKVREVRKEASSQDEAALACASADTFILKVLPDRASARSSPRSANRRTVLDFTEILALLLESGVSLKDSLEIVRNIAPHGNLRDLVTRLLDAVNKGEGFAKALDIEGESFPPLYRGMVRIGERIGSIGSVIPQLARYLRERKSVRERVLGAMTYPLLVLSVAITGTFGVVAFLLPRMLELFSGLNEAVADSMKARIAVMNGIAVGLLVVVLLTVVGSLAIPRLRRKGGAAAEKIDLFILKLPVLKRFLLAYDTVNFAFAMEAMTKGGMPIETALGESAAIAGNAAFRAAILRSRESIVKGQPLSEAIRAQGVFPGYLALWIALGEKSGQDEKVFAQIGRYFQSELDRWSSRFMTLVEPALIVLVGGFILFLVLFFIVPLFTMYGSIL